MRQLPSSHIGNDHRFDNATKDCHTIHMAQKTITETIFVCDVTGEECDNATTFVFAWGGKQFRIDLSGSEARKFSDLMEFYAGKATKLSTRGARTGTARRRNDVSAIREWARAQGLEVSDHGRIAGSVEAAYNKAMLGRDQAEAEAATVDDDADHADEFDNDDYDEDTPESSVVPGPTFREAS